MNKKVEKAIGKALTASLAVGLVAAVPANVANAATVDQLYKAAFDAVQVAKTSKTQSAINYAREAIKALKGTSVEKWAVGEFSKQVDAVQGPKFTETVKAIKKAQETGTQADINAARATVDADYPAAYKQTWSANVDAAQKKLQDKVIAARDKAISTKAQADIDAAKKLIDEVKTASVKGIADWASIMETKLAEGTKVAIVSVKADKVDKLVVTFSKAVDTADVTLAVTKVGSAVAATTEWNADKTVATVTTTAKMTKGTYTVTATSAADKNLKLTGTADIVDQYVKGIVIDDTVALTGTDTNDNDRAYVYYDVLDQYGQSIRTSTTLSWASSAVVKANKTTGMVEFSKANDVAFTYGDKIFVSAVNAKTGDSLSTTVTVGAKQAVNSINVAGYVKKGTTEILKTLPAGFLDNTYYMVYELKDQNGNPMTNAAPASNNMVTFVTDNVLLVKELNKTGETVLSIGGKDYNAIFVSPGMSVDKGGEVNITAIANNTGNKTVINTVVGASQILTKFNVLEPTGIVADGESVVIPFEAFDQNGAKITNFATLAKNETFNKLTFTTSESGSKLELYEKADGTAELKYTDTSADWDHSKTTDGIDRAVSITSLVVGGNNSGIMLSISDKARPEAIKSVNMTSVLVEQGVLGAQLTAGDDNDFIFLDQYGREMSKENALKFFEAGTYVGSEFAGYDFAIRATYKGEAALFNGVDATDEATRVQEIDKNESMSFTSKANSVALAKSGLSVEFEIVKSKTVNGKVEVEPISPKKSMPLTVVDITALKSFAISDLAKFRIDTVKSDDLTGDTAKTGSIALDKTNIGDTIKAANIDGTGVSDSHKQSVKVTGLYNGVSVDVPNEYYSVSANMLKAVDDADDKDTINAVADENSVFTWNKFYDASTARYTRKDASDTIKVTIVDSASATVDSASKVVTISDAAPVATTIVGGTTTVTPTNTNLTRDNLDGDGFTVKDQYGKDINATLTYRVTNVVENANAYAKNNFKVSGNDSGIISINGAERGDKFTLVVKADNVERSIEITVGADANAKIDLTNNHYLNVLLNGNRTDGTLNLENQRKAGLN